MSTETHHLEQQPHSSPSGSTSNIPSNLPTSKHSSSHSLCSTSEPQYKVTSTSTQLTSNPITPSSSNLSTVRGGSDNERSSNSRRKSITSENTGNENHNTEVEGQEDDSVPQTLIPLESHGVTIRNSLASKYAIFVLTDLSQQSTDRDLDNTSSTNGNTPSLASHSHNNIGNFVSPNTSRSAQSSALRTGELASSSLKSASSCDSQSKSSDSRSRSMSIDDVIDERDVIDENG